MCDLMDGDSSPDLYLKPPCKLALRIYFSLGFSLLFLMILGCNLF